MNEIWKLFLSLSLSGSVLALVLLGVRPLVRNRLSKRWQYYIWLLVVLRLLIPFTPQSGAVGYLFDRLETAAPQQEAAGQQELPAGVQRETRQEAPAIQPEEKAGDMPTPSNRVEAGGGLWLLWLGIGALLLARKVAGYYGFVRYVKAGAIKIQDTGMLRPYRQVAAEMGIRMPPPLHVNPQVSSPMLVGALRPVIILPLLEMEEEEQRHVFRHELTHYKRRDILYKWLTQLAVCLHWFNPLVYVVNRAINRDCELSCDESVLGRLGAAGRLRYGDTLLSALKTDAACNGSSVSVALSENTRLLRERLAAILCYKRRSKAALCASVLLTLALLCAAAFTGAYAGAYRAAAPGDSSSGAGVRAGSRAEPAGVSESVSTQSGDQVEDSGVVPRGMRRAPDDLPTKTVRSEGFPAAAQPNVTVIIDNDAAVNLVPAPGGELEVGYPGDLYAVSVEETAGGWQVRISYTGGYSAYPEATLYLPDVVYGKVDLQARGATVYSSAFQKGGDISANLEGASVFWTLPAGFTGKLEASAQACYLELRSADGYADCSVVIANGASFGNIAEGFTKQGGNWVYTNGAQTGTVSIDLGHNSYMTME